MANIPYWRELLGNIIQDAQEKQRIVSVLNVNAVTITRWANNTSNPRMQHLRHLVTVLPPDMRNAMIESITEEYPDFSITASILNHDEEQDEIPSTFYSRVFNTYVMTPKMQRAWFITNQVLQQALNHLDPYQLGMAITLVQCMPPSLDGKVCSLRERTGYGTPPWSVNLEPYTVFLGAESLAGHVVGSCHPRFIQDNDEHKGIVPAHWVEWEKSAAAYPIFCSGKVAGCLVVSSTVPNYFLPYRQKLIQYYTELLVLIFESHEFYDIESINLRIMPYYRTQVEHLTNFRQRVSSLITERLRNGESVDWRHAEALVWQQIEAELLTMPPYTGVEEDHHSSSTPSPDE